MGSCLSKKSTSCSSSKSTSTSAVSSAKNQETTKTNNTQVEKNKEGDVESVKKEVFVIKHRKSHEVERKSDDEKGSAKIANETLESAKNVKVDNGIVVSAPVRTSSCTKEEVDAILIQCGRLSRSSSTGKTSSDNVQRSSRKYSGSKRSYDFENENGNEGLQENVVDVCEDDGVVSNSVRRHRQRQRQPRTPNSPSKGRRRTPSREREQQQQQQRSGSRERGSSSGGGRRVSRSPNRRSESPITTSNSNGGNVASSNNGNRPGKMVSVPATVSSMVMDKSIDADNISAAAIKRIQVKRNADAAVGSRTAASPRARSPARVSANQNQQQQPVSLSRSNSRKHEQSPYRRNPLSEIDGNVVIEQVPVAGLKAVSNNIHSQKLNAENVSNGKAVQQGTENKLGSSKATPNGKIKEQQENKALQTVAGNVAMNVIVSGPESLKPQGGVTRSRSLRLSRDLDINPETLTNPPQSYTALLLEDIQNFHHKSSVTTTPAFSLPACVTKACSILDAVADLNSTTSSNLSSTFSDDRRRNPTSEQFNHNDNTSFGVDLPGKKRLGIKDPFVESEVAVSDDLMEPSIQKYVTFRRGTDIEDQESSGSNSIVGSQQNWLSPSSWEPNSADSTDCWPSSRSYNRDDNRSPLGFERHAVSEISHDMGEGKRRVNVKKRDSDNQQTGIGRGSVGHRESTANAVISESTFTKIISGLNETIGVVLDYLRDAKEHGQMKGDDLLAAVRVVGSYLAEAPDACRDKVTQLLDYMLSIEGEDELSPFYSICFSLPMLCQITLKTGGCKILASSGAYREVFGCLIALIDQNKNTSEGNGSIFLACDTILNLLLKREQIKLHSDDPSFIKLLVALSCWAEGTDDVSIIMMASSICSLILDMTSEEALLNHPDLSTGNITSVSKLIGRSFALCGQDLMSDDAKSEADLFQIITSAYSSWAGRFPRIRQAVESSSRFPFRHVS